MQPITSPSVAERLRTRLGRRGVAFVLALIVELLIALMLLGLIPTITPKEKPKTVTFGIAASDGDAPAAKEEPKAKAKARAKAEQGEQPEQPQPVKSDIVPPPPVPEAKQPPSFLVLTRQDYAAADISHAKASAPAAVAAAEDGGDSDSGGSSGAGDSPVAGKGPHGETLYAAEWYRRPRDSELSPFVPDRARGVEGWGEIACRTVERYHVEDCQELGDFPRGSGYAGAVRRAAPQFLVKPPRVGGRMMVGSWVRIRITYTQRGGE